LRFEVFLEIEDGFFYSLVVCHDDAKLHGSSSHIDPFLAE
jgi:hypothetical protein